MTNVITGELFKISLKEYADRIANLEEEKKEISDQIATVYQEAESKGFDKKALRQALKMLKLQKGERDRQLDLTSQYLDQIGG
jgi:uncharacterized protein (UPF0335 family)